MCPKHGQVNCEKVVDSKIKSVGVVRFTGEKEEDEEEMLRSILAQLEFGYQICKWDDAGMVFIIEK